MSHSLSFASFLFYIQLNIVLTSHTIIFWRTHWFGKIESEGISIPLSPVLSEQHTVQNSLTSSEGAGKGYEGKTPPPDLQKRQPLRLTWNWKNYSAICKSQSHRTLWFCHHPIHTYFLCCRRYMVSLNLLNDPWQLRLCLASPKFFFNIRLKFYILISITIISQSFLY